MTAFRPSVIPALVLFTLIPGPASAATVTTLVGIGTPGLSDAEVNNPYGMVIGPDGALYFCDLGSHRIRRMDLATRRVTTIAGNGQRGYSGDGGPAVEATLSAPHELVFDARGDLYFVERDNHVVRKVDMKAGTISTVAGNGAAGFAGDGGPGPQAQLRQPHCIIRDRDGGLLVCDIGNHRIRRLRTDTGTIDTYAGTGTPGPTPDGTPARGTPLNGPRTLTQAPDGDLYLALREGNAIYRIDARTQTVHHLAGTGQAGYSGDGGPASSATFGGGARGNAARLAGPKGLAYAPDGRLYVVDTENHVIRMIDTRSGQISTVLGTGVQGDGPEPDPLLCKLNRPHGVMFVSGTLYVSDSEAHRIRVLLP